jgi:diguanylate cyclase (GGDEF)-like protein
MHATPAPPRPAYPLSLRLLIGGSAALALPLVALAAVTIAREPPALEVSLAVALFAALAALADVKPVPLDEKGDRSVSLAFVFVLASSILFGWRYAVLIAFVSVLVSQLVERKRPARTLFNCSAYAICALASAAPGLVFEGHPAHAGVITAQAFWGGGVYIAINVMLVCAAITIANRLSFSAVVLDNLRHTGPAFVIMAFLAALAALLWSIQPLAMFLLAGPLFALALYQRSALVSTIALRSALTDSLTGLGNHRSYEAALGEAIERASDGDGLVELSLCLVDVDDFKGINDVYGHQVGDQVLVELAGILEQAEARAYRFGGDEFALIVDADAARAQQVVERVYGSIANRPFAHGHPLRASVGIASFPGHAHSLEELQRIADTALYWAKHHGKNRSCVYGPSTIQVFAPADLGRIAERAAHLRVAESLIRIVDAKDTYTGVHSEAVARLVTAIALELGLDEETIASVRLAGLLHDLGKIAVPDAILQKPSSLADHERRLVRRHAEFGFTLLDGLDIGPVDLWVRHHHEHWDGSGYPDGLAGEEIPLGSRIILVADAYEAITTDRKYRPAATQAEALEELRGKSGTQFDPVVVEALERVLAASRPCLSLVELAA